MSESGNMGGDGAYFLAFAHEEAKAPLVKALEARRAQPENVCRYNDSKGEAKYKHDVARVTVGGVKIQREEACASGVSARTSAGSNARETNEPMEECSVFRDISQSIFCFVDYPSLRSPTRPRHWVRQR